MDKGTKKAEKQRLAAEKKQRKEGERLAKKAEKDQKKVAKLRDRKNSKSKPAVLSPNASAQSDMGDEASGPRQEAPARIAPEVLRDQVTPTKRIGSGCFGDIVSVLMKNDVGEPTAATAIFLKPNSGMLAKQAFLAAASQCAALGEHPAIISVLFQCVRTDPAFVLTKPALPTLKTALVSLAPTNRTAAQISVAAIARILLQLSEGVLFLHENEYYHPDLGARAIHYDSERRVAIKLLDIDRELHADDYCSHSSRGLRPIRWMAPESLVDDVTTTLTMVWMFGVLFWEVFSFCARPYANVDEANIVATVRKGVPLDKPIGCPDAMYYMMLGCWDLEMGDRPSCERLRNFLKTFSLEEHEDTYQTADANEPIQHGALEPVDVPEKVMTDGPDSTIQIREDGKGSTADGIDDAPLEVNDDDSVLPRVADDAVAPESTVPLLVPDDAVAPDGTVPPLVPDDAVAPDGTVPSLVLDDARVGDEGEGKDDDDDDLAFLLADTSEATGPLTGLPDAQDGAENNDYDCVTPIGTSGADVAGAAGHGGAESCVNAAERSPDDLPSVAAADTAQQPTTELFGSGMTDVGDVGDDIDRDMYPGTELRRCDVSTADEDWSVVCPAYSPPWCSIGERTNADDIMAVKWNVVSGNDSAKSTCSLMGEYQIDPESNAPLNPTGRVGFSGRGHLPQFGPTQLCCAVVSRWQAQRQNDTDDMVLEFVVGRSPSSSDLWVLPTAELKVGEEQPACIAQCFGPAAVDHLQLPDDVAGARNGSIVNMFQNGFNLHTGYFNHDHNTDNAWYEVVCNSYHDASGCLDDIVLPNPGVGDSSWVRGSTLKWATLESVADNLNSLHYNYMASMMQHLIGGPRAGDDEVITDNGPDAGNHEMPADDDWPEETHAYEYEADHNVTNTNEYATFNDTTFNDTPGEAEPTNCSDLVDETQSIDTPFATFNDTVTPVAPADMDTTAVAALDGGTGEAVTKYVAISTMQEVDAPFGAPGWVKGTGGTGDAPGEDEPTYYSDLVGANQSINTQPAPEVTPRQGAATEEEEALGMYQNERAILEQVKRVQTMQGSLPGPAASKPVQRAAANTGTTPAPPSAPADITAAQPHGGPTSPGSGQQQQLRRPLQQQQQLQQQQHLGQPAHLGMYHPMVAPQGPRMPGMMHGHSAMQGMMPLPQQRQHPQHPQHHAMQPRMMPPHIVRPQRVPVQQQLFPDGYGGYYDAMGGYYDAMGYYYNPQQLQAYAQQYDQGMLGGGGGGYVMAAPGSTYGHQPGYGAPQPRLSPGAGAGTGAVPGYLSSARRPQNHQPALRANQGRTATGTKNDYVDEKDIVSLMRGAGKPKAGVRQRVWADGPDPPPQRGIRQRVWDDGAGSQDPTKARPAMPRTGRGGGIPRHLQNRGSAPSGGGFAHTARPRQRQAPVGPTQAYTAQHSWDNRVISSVDTAALPQPHIAPAPRSARPDGPAQRQQQQQQPPPRSQRHPSQSAASNPSDVDTMAAAADVDAMAAAADHMPSENSPLPPAAVDVPVDVTQEAAISVVAAPAAVPADATAPTAPASTSVLERSLDDMFGSTPVLLTKAEQKIESERAVHTKLDRRSRVILNDADDDSDYDEANVELYTDLRDVTVVKDPESGFGFVVKGNAPVAFLSIDKGCAAEVAGLRASDVVVAINGTDVWDHSQPQLVEIFRAAGAEPMLLSVKHMTYEELLTIRERIRDGDIDHLRWPANELHV